MEINFVNVLIILAFLFPLIKGCIKGFSSDSIKEDIESVEGDINFFISMIVGLFLMRKIFIQHESGIYNNIYSYIPTDIVEYLQVHPQMLYIIVLPLIIILIYQVFKLLFYVLNITIIFPIIDSIDRSLDGNKGFSNRIISLMFEIPRAFCYVIFITLVLNGLVFMNISSDLNNYLSQSYLYSYACKNVIIPVANTKLAKEIPQIINNSFKIETKQASNSTNNTSDSATQGDNNVVVYYNGITLDEGVKSNSEIDAFAKRLVANESTENGKAKKIYNWIGLNVDYDYSKADKILKNNLDEKSGAVVAFEEKKGICFDYSCLYVAMCRAVGLKVRLITGEGFNGMSWVSHAWNQVEVNGKWINVDTTFYNGGNYFNSEQFNMDHRAANLAGQW